MFVSLSTGLVLELIRTSWQGEVGEDGEMVVRRHDKKKGAGQDLLQNWVSLLLHFSYSGEEDKSSFLPRR